MTWHALDYHVKGLNKSETWKVKNSVSSVFCIMLVCICISKFGYLLAYYLTLLIKGNFVTHGCHVLTTNCNLIVENDGFPCVYAS